jgi:hypothetical protein
MRQRLDDERKPHVRVSIDGALLDRYEGRYTSSDMTVTIVRDGNHLLAQVNGYYWYSIYPYTNSDFFATSFRTQYSFVKSHTTRQAQLQSGQNGAKGRPTGLAGLMQDEPPRYRRTTPPVAARLRPDQAHKPRRPENKDVRSRDGPDLVKTLHGVELQYKCRLWVGIGRWHLGRINMGADRITEPLRQFGPDIWLAEGPVTSFHGFPYAARMAVIQLSDGSLFVWSPVALSDPLRASVNALGPVRHLVSPNALHHLFLGE